MNMIDNPPNAGNGYSGLGTDKIHREHLGAGGFEGDTEFNDTLVRYLDESVVSPGQARVRFEDADYVVVIPSMHNRQRRKPNQLRI